MTQNNLSEKIVNISQAGEGLKGFLDKIKSGLGDLKSKINEFMKSALGFELFEAKEEAEDQKKETTEKTKKETQELKDIIEKLKDLTPDQIKSFLYQSITGQESAGDYTKINKDSGAIGLGQVMPENIPTWTKEALGKKMTPEEFKKDKKAQEKTVKYWLGKYYDKQIKETNGDILLAIKRVSAQWYSGDPENYNNTKKQYYAGTSYPSISDYSNQIAQRFSKDIFDKNNDIYLA